MAAVTISGTTSGVADGQTVAINISSSAGGTPINTTATTTSNSYSVTDLDLSSLADGTLSITADVSDLAGNSATPKPQIPQPKTPHPPTISVAINDGGDGLPQRSRTILPSPSLAPHPALLTVKPLPSTSPPQLAALPSTPPPPPAATAIPSRASISPPLPTAHSPSQPMSPT